jgi:hypothetical protein
MTIGPFATGRVRDGRGASVTEGVPCPFREPPVNVKTSHQPKTPRPMKTKIVLRDPFHLGRKVFALMPSPVR